LSLRIGNGFDAHKFVKGRKLILGGVEIPYEFGLAGHSDADVLTHAVIDALLGAIGERDIGAHFPPEDPEYKDASSLSLLSEVMALVLERGYRVVNVDTVVVCENPKLKPFIYGMKSGLSECLRVSPEDVGVKATTTEGLGYIGRGEGISSYAVALLEKKS